MGQIATLTAWHRAQLGAAEQPPGSNRIRYNTIYWGREVSGASYPWCMAYVDVGFRECGLSELFYGGYHTASCTALLKYAIKTGQLYTSGFRAGDVVLYDQDGVTADSEHTGFVVAARSDSDLDVVEGNCGDAVKLTHPKRSSIIGVYRPKYEDAEYQPEVPATDSPSVMSVELPLLCNGMTGKSVLAMQYLLLAYGYKLPKYGADGECGSETEAAIRAYQAAHGLDVDGVCGAKTWAALLS